MQNPDEQQRINKLIGELIANKNIPDETKSALVSQVNDIRTPLVSDPWIYRIVVISLGLTVLATVIGGLVIKVKSAQNIPEGLIALGSAAVGALAGLLAPPPKS